MVNEFSGRATTLWLDEAATQLADIAEYQPGSPAVPGQQIAGSRVTLGQGSNLPRFWFPDGVDVLYATVYGMAGTWTVTADIDARLDSVNPAAVYRPSLRMPRPSVTPITLAGSADFTASGSGVGSSLMNDTSDFDSGDRSSRITTAGNGGFANFDRFGKSAMDFTGKQPAITLKVTDIARLSRISFYLGTSSLANSFKWTIILKTASTNWVQSGEYVLITLPWSDITNAAGTYTFTNGVPSTRTGFTDLRVQGADDATGTVEIRVDAVGAVPDGSAVFPNGVISITTDDDDETISTYLAPAMQAKGWAGTEYLIGNTLDGVGRQTLSRLLGLQDRYGWEMSAHAGTDLVHNATGGITGVTAAQLEEDARLAKIQLVSRGFTGEGFAYPQGRFGLTSDGQPTWPILRRYFSYGRTIQYVDNGETIFPAQMDRLRAISGISSVITAGDRANTTKMVAADGTLDRIKAGQQWGILVFHKFVLSNPTVSTQCTVADMQAVLDGISSRGIPVLPVADVLRRAQAAA